MSSALQENLEWFINIEAQPEAQKTVQTLSELQKTVNDLQEQNEILREDCTIVQDQLDRTNSRLTHILCQEASLSSGSDIENSRNSHDNYRP